MLMVTKAGSWELKDPLHCSFYFCLFGNFQDNVKIFLKNFLKIPIDEMIKDLPTVW